ASRAADRREARAAGREEIEQARIARRAHDGHLELREVGDDGRQHPVVDLEAHAVVVEVVPRALAVGRGVESLVAHGEVDALGQEALVDLQRLLDDLAERRLVALPAEGAHRQVAIDALDRAIVERAVRRGDDAAEGDALRRQALLDRLVGRASAIARAVGLAAELRAHLAREERDRTEAEEMRRVALIGHRAALAVAAEERVLRLRARAVRSALRVAAEAAERIGPAGRAPVHALQLRRVADRLPIGSAVSPAVLGAEEVAEELVADDEERVGGELAVVERVVVEGRVLDELAGIVRVEHAVEALALAKLDRLLELLEERRIVGDGAVVDGDAGDRRRLASGRGPCCPLERDHERQRDARRPEHGGRWYQDRGGRGTGFSPARRLVRVIRRPATTDRGRGSRPRCGATCRRGSRGRPARRTGSRPARPSEPGSWRTASDRRAASDRRRAGG